MARFFGGLLLVAIVLVGTAFAFGLVRVQQTQDARIPQLKVESGTLPSYQADVAKVEVGTKAKTIEVPTLDVKKPE